VRFDQSLDHGVFVVEASLRKAFPDCVLDRNGLGVTVVVYPGQAHTDVTTTDSSRPSESSLCHSVRPAAIADVPPPIVTPTYIRGVTLCLVRPMQPIGCRMDGLDLDVSVYL
jgi:hypothetical protein